MPFSAPFWRRWHRWIAFPATLFLLWASLTGILVAGTEFFGEEERLREATRDVVSPVTLRGDLRPWETRLEEAFAAAADSAGNAPVDKVTIFFKGEHPTVTVFTGEPGGGEDRSYEIDALAGRLTKLGSYADKPLINRLHSGEAFGDGGLWVAMGWGLALAFLTASGLVVYVTMWRPGLEGIRKVFW